MDVVYIVGPGEQNEELRYSLRSLRNLPHDAVWIAGYIPKWVTGVGRIPTEQKGHKFANALANITAACTHPEVSEEFVYFNDDFYVIRPTSEVPTLHRGPIEPLLDKRRRRRSGASYNGGRADTFRLLHQLGYPDPIAYEPIHVPMRFTKSRLLETLEVGKSVPALHYRTLYGNQWSAGGTVHANVKVSDTAKGFPKGSAFVSTNTRSFERGEVGRLIRNLFPDPSPYEDPNVPHQPVPVRNARRGRLRRVQPRRNRRAD